MPRPVSLFTGQWADLPARDALPPRPQSFGYDGLELACWGDHFDVARGARATTGYCERQWELLADHGLACFAISTHLVGQAVCDRIDERHQAILPAARLGRRRPRGRAPARGRRR